MAMFQYQMRNEMCQNHGVYEVEWHMKHFIILIMSY